MKKKIKDLTVSECSRYCNTHKGYCYDCPLNATGNVNPTCIRNAVSKFSNEYLEEEVEIDENR